MYSCMYVCRRGGGQNLTSLRGFMQIVACLRHSVWISERASERADEIVCITYIYIRFVGVAFITSAPPVFPVLRATGQSVDMVVSGL